MYKIHTNERKNGGAAFNFLSPREKKVLLQLVLSYVYMPHTETLHLSQKTNHLNYKVFLCICTCLTFIMTFPIFI